MEIIFVEIDDLPRSLFLGAGFFLYLVLAVLISHRQVADICDVLDQAHLIAGVFKDAAQYIGEQIRSDVADMDVVVDGRSAHINADLAGVDRMEVLLLLCQRIMDFQHGYIFLGKRGHERSIFYAQMPNPSSVSGGRGGS